MFLICFPSTRGVEADLDGFYLSSGLCVQPADEGIHGRLAAESVASPATRKNVAYFVCFGVVDPIDSKTRPLQTIYTTVSQKFLEVFVCQGKHMTSHLCAPIVFCSSTWQIPRVVKRSFIPGTSDWMIRVVSPRSFSAFIGVFFGPLLLCCLVFFWLLRDRSFYCQPPLLLFGEQCTQGFHQDK